MKLTKKESIELQFYYLKKFTHITRSNGNYKKVQVHRGEPTRIHKGEHYDHWLMCSGNSITDCFDNITLNLGEYDFVEIDQPLLIKDLIDTSIFN